MVTGAVHAARDQRWSACITLPPRHTSPRAARALLRVAMDQWDIGALPNADLLLSEVVTNAVVHAHTPVQVRVVAQHGWARVEVQDCSPAPPRRRTATGHAEHGRGLLLLDALANDWGWTHRDSGDACKAVWFEVTDAPDADDPTAGGSGADDPAAHDPDAMDPELFATFDVDDLEDVRADPGSS